VNEQTIAHLATINGINTSPELMATIEVDEETGTKALLFNNQILETGQEVEYHGKKLPVVFGVPYMGTIPDVEDKSVVLGRIPTSAFDPKVGTIVTTFEIKYDTKPGTTIVGADPRLSIGGVNVKQEDFYAGMGCHINCNGKWISLFHFLVPNTVLGYKPEAVAHPHGPADD
jgi:hypothetical protein